MEEALGLVEEIISTNDSSVIDDVQKYKSVFRRLGLERVVSDLPRYDCAIRVHPGYTEMTNAMVDSILSVASNRQKNESLRVLELGPGTGTFTTALINNIPHHIELSFVEPDMEALAFTKVCVKKTAVKNVNLVGEFTDILEIGGGEFDVIAASFAFHHIPDKQKLKSLKKMKGLLSPNGKIAFGEEFILPYENTDERKTATVEYHKIVIRELLNRNSNNPSDAYKDMAIIETLAMINGLINFD